MQSSVQSFSRVLRGASVELYAEYWQSSVQIFEPLAELHAELLAELRAELLAELRAELLAELRAELLAEPLVELRAELRAELRVELGKLIMESSFKLELL